MRKLTDWRLLLLLLLAPALLTGCVGTIALQVLDAAVGGVYVAAEAWGSQVGGDFFNSLVEEDQP